MRYQRSSTTMMAIPSSVHQTLPNFELVQFFQIFGIVCLLLIYGVGLLTILGKKKSNDNEDINTNCEEDKVSPPSAIHISKTSTSSSTKSPSIISVPVQAPEQALIPFTEVTTVTEEDKTPSKISEMKELKEEFLQWKRDLLTKNEMSIEKLRLKGPQVRDFTGDYLRWTRWKTATRAAFYSGGFQSTLTGESTDDENAAKKSAVEGAQNLVTAGLSALFGTSEGQGMEQKSFIVLFLNNVFVRVDYYAYTYNVNASIWGAEEKISGACYIADLSVLKTEDLTPGEIDYFLSQALSVSNGELTKVNQLKVALVQSAILSRALKDPDLSFKDLADIANELAEAQEAISKAFESLEDYKSPLKSIANERLIPTDVAVFGSTD